MNQLTTRFKKLKNRKGFTLVELIVVIVIIGILAAIIIPKFSGFSARANLAADTATARTIATALNVLVTNGDATPTIDEAVTANLLSAPGNPKTGGAWAITLDAKGYPTEITANGVSVWTD